MKDKIKNLHLLFFKEGDAYLSLRQRITKTGKVCGVGSFARWSKQQNLKQQKEQSFIKQKNSMGMCLFCGDNDFTHLEQHHPYPIELPKFTITLCANCHSTLHFYTGGNGGVRNG